MHRISRNLGNVLTSGNERYERKFRMERTSEQVQDTIVKSHPRMFSDLYHPRYVNNIYFDTRDRSSFRESVAGDSERLKIRVRWYGDLFGHAESPVLELKRKINMVGLKYTFPLPSFSLKDITLDGMREGFSSAQLPENLLLELRCLDFAVVNRYRRRYYQSADRRFRITLDTELAYYPIAPSHNAFNAMSRDEHAVILELKYDSKHDDAARSVTRDLPCRVTKSSKFVDGMTLAYGL